MSPLSSDRANPASDPRTNLPAEPGSDVTDRIFEEICLEEINLGPMQPAGDAGAIGNKSVDQIHADVSLDQQVCPQASSSPHRLGKQTQPEVETERNEICLDEFPAGEHNSTHDVALELTPIDANGNGRMPGRAKTPVEPSEPEGSSNENGIRIESLDSEPCHTSSLRGVGEMAPTIPPQTADADPVICIESLDLGDDVYEQGKVRSDNSGPQVGQTPDLAKLDAAPAEVQPVPHEEAVIRFEGFGTELGSNSLQAPIEGGAKQEVKAAAPEANSAIRIEGLEPEAGPGSNQSPSEIAAVEGRDSATEAAEPVIRIEGLDLETAAESETAPQESPAGGVPASDVAIDWCAQQDAATTQVPNKGTEQSAPTQNASSTPGQQVTKVVEAAAATPACEGSATPGSSSPEPKKTPASSVSTSVLTLAPVQGVMPAPVPSTHRFSARMPEIQPRITAGFPLTVEEVSGWVERLVRHPFASLRELRTTEAFVEHEVSGDALGAMEEVDQEKLESDFGVLDKVDGGWGPRALFVRFLRRPDAEAEATWMASLRVEIAYALLLLGVYFGIYIMTEMLR